MVAGEYITRDDVSQYFVGRGNSFCSLIEHKEVAVSALWQDLGDLKTLGRVRCMYQGPSTFLETIQACAWDPSTSASAKHSMSRSALLALLRQQRH